MRGILGDGSDEGTRAAACRIVGEILAEEEERRAAPQAHERQADRRSRDDLVDAVAIEIGQAYPHAVLGARRIGEEAAERVEVRAAPHPHVRAAAVDRSRPRHDVGEPVPVDVARGDVDPAHEGRVVGEEAADLRERRAVPHPHVRSAPEPRAGDDVGEAVAVDVARGHVHAAGECRVVGEEAADWREGHAVPDPDVRSAAGPRAGDDVRAAIAVDVARGDEHASGERRVVREEAADLGERHAIPHAHVRAAAGPRPGDDVELPVAVHVAERDAHASDKRRIVREEAPIGARRVDHAHRRRRTRARRGDEFLRGRCRGNRESRQQGNTNRTKFALRHVESLTEYEWRECVVRGRRAQV